MPGPSYRPAPPWRATCSREHCGLLLAGLGIPQVCQRLCCSVAGALRSQLELENRIRVFSQTLPCIDFSGINRGITWFLLGNTALYVSSK